jgi:Tol biopolymer transport system component
VTTTSDVRIALLAAALGARVEAQTTLRVSVDSSGLQANGRSNLPALSADGRFVAFEDSATNLVPGDTNGFLDIFVRDRATGATTRVSVSSAGAQANGESRYAAISDDGRYVAFQSDATNLSGPDTNQVADVFVHDRLTGQTTRVSVDASGAPGPAFYSSTLPSISADGRYVAFTSGAPFVPWDVNQRADIYVRDLSTGALTIASVDSAGLQADGNSSSPAISADGRSVAFISLATNLRPGGDTNGVNDVFVHDLQTGQTTCVSVDSSGALGNNQSTGPSISDDGRYVAFQSDATNLVPGDQGFNVDVFVHDLLTGQTTLQSVNSSGVQANQSSYFPALSGDGRYVAFQSTAGNLVSLGGGGWMHVYLRDRQAGQTTRVSLDAAGQPATAHCQYPAISARGRYVAFVSVAWLVPEDTNTFEDVYLRDRLGTTPVLGFCAGDGSGTACPCGNYGDATHGCENSAGAGGAHLAASGAARVGADTFQLAGTGMPSSGAALYFQGTAPLQSGFGLAFGDGLRCVGGSVLRLGTKINSGGASAFGAPAGDAPISQAGRIPPGGGTYYYQVWYRDLAPGFCSAANENLSNALMVPWAP